MACSISGPRGAFDFPKWNLYGTRVSAWSVVSETRQGMDIDPADYFFTDKVYSLKSVEEEFIVLKQELHRKKI